MPQPGTPHGGATDTLSRCGSAVRSATEPAQSLQRGNHLERVMGNHWERAIIGKVQSLGTASGYAGCWYLLEQHWSLSGQAADRRGISKLPLGPSLWGYLQDNFKVLMWSEGTHNNSNNNLQAFQLIVARYLLGVSECLSPSSSTNKTSRH